MAHAFDNGSFTHEKKQTFYSPLLSRRDNLLETSSSSQLSLRSNHIPPSYEETVNNHQNSISTDDDSSYHRKQKSGTDDYFTITSRNSNTETKPPAVTRTPRITSTANNNYIHRPNILSQYSTNRTKPNTTYLNTTQLYITPPSSEDPPPPPPRHPIHPPAIPPRNPIISSSQKNSVTIPDFNSSLSPKTIYRSSISTPTVERHHFVEPQLNPLTIDTNPHIQDSIDESTIGEYFGDCRKCGETITNLDDPCDLLGQIYHGSCAVCVICGQSVKNKHFYMKDQLYCEDDFLNTGICQTFEHCIICKRLINDTIIQAIGETYHLTCFKCSKCSIYLDGKPFIKDKNGKLFCLHDYYIIYGTRCNKCTKPILPENNSYETVRILSMGKTFHIECYQCEDCSIQLGDEDNHRCYPLDDVLLCRECCCQRLVYVNKF